MKKMLYAGLLLLILIPLTYIIGPRPGFETIDANPIEFKLDINNVEDFIENREAKVPQLKVDNNARIIWNDSIRQKTKYSVVYLHGFSASQEEGDPIHENFAKRYGCNLYLSRLADHGRLDSNTFKDLTPKALLESAKFALEVGKLLGDNVILMSCSTGGTFSAYLAANDPAVHSLIMYSPNINLHDPMAELVNGPWGKELLGIVYDGEYKHIPYPPLAAKHWNADYHIDGIVALGDLIDMTMKDEEFEKITQPVYIGYYHKNDVEEDKIVSIPAMKSFYKTISTPENKKHIEAFPNVGGHVISSYVMSKDIESVQNSTFKFAEEILGLKPNEKPTTSLIE